MHESLQSLTVINDIHTLLNRAITRAFMRHANNAVRKDVMKLWTSFEMDTRFWRIRTDVHAHQAWTHMRAQPMLADAVLEATFSFTSMYTLQYGEDAYRDLVHQLAQSSQAMQMATGSSVERVTIADSDYVEAMWIDVDTLEGLYLVNPWLVMLVLQEVVGFQISIDFMRWVEEADEVGSGRK